MNLSEVFKGCVLGGWMENRCTKLTLFSFMCFILQLKVFSLDLYVNISNHKNLTGWESHTLPEQSVSHGDFVCAVDGKRTYRDRLREVQTVLEESLKCTAFHFSWQC